MKKLFRNVLIRAICILALGIVLIAFSTQVTQWMVMASGALFIIPGCVSIVSYFRRDPESRQIMLYPIVGAGSILFGLILLVFPELFIEAFMYLLSAVLVLGAATQYYTLWDLHRGHMRVRGWYYLVPTLELAAGLFIFISDHKAEIAGLPVIIIGGGFVTYALLEFLTLYLVKTSNPDKDGRRRLAS